jgi:putative acetyltransferase
MNKMERETGFEPATSTLARSHSTTELFPLARKGFSVPQEIRFEKVREGSKDSKGFEKVKVLIRPEQPGDWLAVHHVNESAFDGHVEVDLVDALRQQVPDLVSLVAEHDGSIIGHILFSPVTLSNHSELRIMGLAPMAVAPPHQRSGIGTALVNAGVERCRELGFGAVAVLGHAEYYPRFGFRPAKRFGIGCEYDVPDEVFMLLELRPGFLTGASGIIKYHDLFQNTA